MFHNIKFARAVYIPNASILYVISDLKNERLSAGFLSCMLDYSELYTDKILHFCT